MAHCWEMRGCDEEMRGRCPHNIPGEPCPADCNYSACFRPPPAVVTDILELLKPDLNYDPAIKEVCHVCKNFLDNGPDLTSIDGTPKRQGNPNRFLL